MTRCRIGYAAIFLSVVACGGSTEPDGAGAQPTHGASGTELVDALCDSLSALQCSAPLSNNDCVSDRRASLAQAESRGCSALYEAYLACAVFHTPTCGGWTEEPDHPVVSFECSLGSDFYECMLGDMVDCVIVGCSVSCPNGSSACGEPDPSGVSTCVCDSGPHAGDSYSAAYCGQDMAEQMASHCF